MLHKSSTFVQRLLDLLIPLLYSITHSPGNYKIELFTFCNFLLHESVVLLFPLSFKSALYRDDVENDEEVGDEVPGDARVLVDDLVIHVCRDVRQLFFAVTQVNEISDLGVEVDCSARAAVAVKQEAAKAALARVRLLTVLVVEAENKPANVHRVQEDHEVETKPDPLCVKCFVPMRILAHQVFVKIDDIGGLDEEEKLDCAVEERLELEEARMLGPERVD